jgi:integrase
MERLNARFVASVKATDDRREILDVVARGLALRVSPNGVKSWSFRYRRRSDGRRRNVTLGVYPDHSLDAARLWAHEMRATVARGEDPAAAIELRRDADTFAAVADEWLDKHAAKNKSPRVVADDRSMLTRHILPAIGAMKAGEVSKRDINRLLDAVVSKPDARTTNAKRPQRHMTIRPNRVFELVRAIFRWTVGRGELRVDPTIGMSPPIKRERPRERELSAAEMRSFWHALDKAPMQRESWRRRDGELPMRRGTAIALQLALVTGQRIGEVTGISLTELQLDDDEPTWRIPGPRTKNGELHRVPLSPLAVRLITEARALAGSSPWLFPGPNGVEPIAAHAATRALERARPVIDIADFRTHDLRRTMATKLEEMGTPPHVVGHVLNHASASSSITKKHYALHTYESEKRKALDAWGARLEGIIASG